VTTRSVRVLLAASGIVAAASWLSAQRTTPPPAGRPGPDILYAPPATAPQLENTGVWRAAPIMMSGVTAYRAGEFLYQDYLYDDRGAGGRAQYPDAPELYAGNAADLVEVRLKPLANETAIRLTFNSMKAPELVGATIALAGDTARLVEAPFGAHARMLADVFVTVHGTTAALTSASGAALASKATAVVDLVFAARLEAWLRDNGW
jgi:hypothetical protein